MKKLLALILCLSILLLCNVETFASPTYVDENIETTVNADIDDTIDNIDAIRTARADEILFDQNFVPETNADSIDDDIYLFSSEYPNDLESMRSRAEAIINYEWTANSNITQWNSSSQWKKGSTVKGMPYTLFVTGDIGHDPLLSLAQYKSKVSDNKSTRARCCSLENDEHPVVYRTGPIYGSCCATFVSEVFGGWFMSGDSPRFDGCRQFKNDSGTHAKVFEGKVRSIKEGDALITSGHIIWVGKITDTTMTIYEQTPPKARKKI